MSFARKVWRRGRNLLPVSGFQYDRPVVLLQSDDWGRVGLRDQAGVEELRADGLELGGNPYDWYTLETREDLGALIEMLLKHRDASGRNPCLGMNFILANPDFAKMRAEEYRSIHLLPLADGLPEGWSRPGLAEAYRDGIAHGVFYPALHGTTHFCRAAVERQMRAGGERCDLIRKFWRAGTPYVYWRMPWIGYEYWDPELPEGDRFLSREKQTDLIGQAVGGFAKMFAAVPKSACAPGYRANGDTLRVWAEHGIQVAQNGPSDAAPPRFDRNGVLQISRTLELEPAMVDNFSLETSLSRAEVAFQCGVPAIVAIHSINFHSTMRDYRGKTLPVLDQFLSALETRHPDLLYLHDSDLHEVTTKGTYAGPNGAVRVKVEKKLFSRAMLSRRQTS